MGQCSQSLLFSYGNFENICIVLEISILIFVVRWCGKGRIESGYCCGTYSGIPLDHIGLQVLFQVAILNTLQKMEPACMAQPSRGFIPGKTGTKRVHQSSRSKKMLWNLPVGDIVVHCPPPSGTSRNFCKQTSSNIYSARLHFCGCLRFRNTLNGS